MTPQKMLSVIFTIVAVNCFLSGVCASSAEIVPIKESTNVETIVIKLSPTDRLTIDLGVGNSNQFLSYRKSLSNDEETPCEMAGYRFACLKLTKAIGEAEAHTSVMFLAPVPNVAFSVLAPDLGLSKTGTRVTSKTPFAFSNLVSGLDERFSSYGNIMSGFDSLEPVELVHDGDAALAFLQRVVGRLPAFECFDEAEICYRYFDFDVKGSSEIGIVRCGVYYAFGIVSDPDGCRIEAIKTGDKWLLLSLLSPRPVQGGLGDGFAGIYCIASNTGTVPLDRLVRAIKTAMQAPPFEMNINHRVSSGTARVAGQRRGVLSEILKNARFGNYFENKSVFGSATITHDEITFTAAMVITVSRARSVPDEQFYELKPAEADRYFDAVTKLLKSRLDHELGVDFDCQMGA